jgi:hypothetical protein
MTEAWIIHDPLPGRCAVEIGHVDDARQSGILTGDGTNRIGQELAPPVVCVVMLVQRAFSGMKNRTSL